MSTTVHRVWGPFRRLFLLKYPFVHSVGSASTTDDFGIAVFPPNNEPTRNFIEGTWAAASNLSSVIVA